MGIHERDWYQEHYEDKVLGIKKKRRTQDKNDSPDRQAGKAILQARPRQTLRASSWAERNWWRILLALAALAAILAVLRKLAAL